MAALEEGGVIAIPTDTVYGLACSAFSLDGVRRIYELKGRSYTKALPVLLGDRDQLPLIAKDVPAEAEVLMEKFWPGALTLVFKTAPTALHAARGKSTIAVRIPDHGVIRQILDVARVPLASTSANTSGEPSLVSGEAVVKRFRGEVDLIVDGGRCHHAKESTVIDASHFPFTVLRAGALSKEKVAAALKL